MQYLTMAMRNKWNESCYEKKRQQVDYINNYLLTSNYNVKKKGRPGFRWIGDIVEFAGLLWHRNTIDVKTWKILGDAFTRKWDKL